MVTTVLVLVLEEMVSVDRVAELPSTEPPVPLLERSDSVWLIPFSLSVVPLFMITPVVVGRRLSPPPIISVPPPT